MRTVIFVRTLCGLLALACMAAGAAYRHGTHSISNANTAATTTAAPINANPRLLQLEQSANRISHPETLHRVLNKK